jgi:acetyl-CoA C-acetyltransferase
LAIEDGSGSEDLKLEPVYILSAVPTAIGDFGGSLSDFAPAELGSLIIAEAVRRAALVPQDVQHVVLGNVIPTTPKEACLARVTAIGAGIPVEAPAPTLNRLCGSGVQAMVIERTDREAAS